MPAASFVAIAVRVNPVPAGLCRRARHENALTRDTKTFKPTVESTKKLRCVLDRSYDSQGLVEINVPQAVEEI